MIHIAGAFSKSHILIPYILQNNLKGKVCVYDGILKCKWNGGRINKLLKFPLAEETRKILDTYHKLKIPVFLTFSNFEIDLNFSWGHRWLSALEPQDGIILVNENFRQFLRKEYPHLTLIYSITGHSNNYKDFDVSLEEKYDLIVPRFENVFNPEFLKVANTSKYEVMLNDTCRFGCDKWQDHFQKISEVNRIYSLEENMSISELSKIQECWLPNFDPNTDSKHECMDLTTEQIKKALGLGYKHFKFTGRENKDSDYLYDLNLYTQRLKESDAL